MKRLIGGSLGLVAGILAVAMLTAPALTWTRDAPSVLDRLENGLWELRDLRNESVVRASVCVGDRLLLAQPQHGAAACRRVVISSNEREMVVHYTCPSAGFGRTTIRYETPRLARIESQGIFRHAPFGFRAEARRVGPCGGASAARR